MQLYPSYLQVGNQLVQSLIDFGIVGKLVHFLWIHPVFVKFKVQPISNEFVSNLQKDNFSTSLPEAIVPAKIYSQLEKDWMQIYPLNLQSLDQLIQSWLEVGVNGKLSQDLLKHPELISQLDI